MTDATPLLDIRDLHVAVDGKEILKGLTLTVGAGEVHALMGRNGSGKSTLSATLMGHPRYKVTAGTIRYKGEDLTTIPVHERARKGVFLCFQYPLALPGVQVSNFLRQSVKAVRGDVPTKEFRPLVKKHLETLGIPQAFMTRYVNDGFSGGEKKRMEILHMLLLEPSLAILDETDSGLDIDALKVVAEGINRLRSKDRGVLLVTHYQRILDLVVPDHVHVLLSGRIVKSGGADLARELEVKGYDWLEQEAA
ncbi:MAG: Fe-S cluster assembly ATPase SufC [Planctomycetes bacterium]|nr:Fe-S cluster assembly ATPase SufC [Planctomycetota bacterium]